MIYFCLPFLFKVIPLYLNMGLGYIAGKTLGASRDSFAKLMLYMFAPMVIFNGVINTQLNVSVLLLPFITFLICIILSFLFYWLATFIWSDSTKNLVGFSAGTGNTGYFGLPLALLLFDDQGEGIYIMAILGVTLYENTIGFCMIASGRHTIRETLVKLIKLPALYALAGGLIINLMHLPKSEIFVDFMQHIKGAYTVLGMMIIGLGLAGLKGFKVDLRFIGITFLARFIAWPLMVGLIIVIDRYGFGLFDTTMYQALALLSFVPLAVNMVILASLMDVHPEKASAAVLLSTVVAIFYIPLMAGCFLL